MKTKLLMIMLLAILGMSQVAQAQTSVSGFISSNTNWTLTGSPYIITGNTILDSGFVLTIDPGVVVKFNASKSLQINGNLRAIGNSSNKIIFTSNQVTPAPGDWGYILFSDNSQDYDYTFFSGSIMEHCLVEYAGGVVLTGGVSDGAIRISRSFPFINFCEVRNNSITGIRFSEDPNGAPTLDVIKITNCNVHDNNSPFNGNQIAGGIGVSVNQAQAIISNNIITDNVGYEAGGIYCTVNNPNTQITNNSITKNTSRSSGGGIGIAGGGNISYNLVYGNSASQGGGIFYYANGGTISNNVLINNSASIEAGAIYTNSNYFWPSNTQIVNNTIIDNNSYSSSGIYCNDPQNSIIKFNTITRNNSIGGTANQRTFAVNQYAANNSGFLFNNNNLYLNKGDNSFYEFTNALPQANGNINVNNCWWGTTSTAIIDSFIFDFLDNGANGVVDYTPFLSTPDTIAPVSPPLNVIKTDLGSGNIQLSWTANTETDLAGYKIYYGSPTGYSYTNSVNAGNVSTYTLSGVSITDTIAVTAYDNLMNGTNDQLDGNESWFTNSIGKPIVNFSASMVTVCAGDTVYYADNTIDAASWTWNFPGGMPAVSSAKNPKVIYYASGAYSAKLKVTNIAGSDSLTITNYISVDSLPNPIITAGGPINFCQGNSVTLDAGAGYTSYLWSGSESTQSIVVSSAGSYSVNVSNNCGNTTAAISVNVNPLPTVSLVLNIDTVCLGTSVFALSGGLPATGVYSGTGVTSGNFDPSIAGSGTHTITYIYSDGNSCSDSATATIYVDLCTGIQTSTLSEPCSFFPNPSTGIFTLDSQITEGIITIYNIQGEKIYQTEIKNEKPVIDLSNQPNGIYLCKIIVKNKTILKKMTIDK